MAESRIIKRNVLFWGKSGLQLAGIMLIFMVVYGFLFNMGSGSMLGDFWKTAYFYGGIISVLFALIGPVSYVGAYLPLTLSFGSGRREAVFGAQIFCIVYGVSTYIIMVLAGIMSSGKLDGKLNVLIAVLFIFMTAVGQLVLVAQMHFGIKGMIIGIVFLVLCMVVGLVTGIGFIDQIMAWINKIQTNVVWILLAIGAIVSIALYAVSVMVLFREMKHYEVKA
ncbi:MAG: membrane-spanning protein [Roseburia inulinivorans]